jgi:hypothetical protein
MRYLLLSACFAVTLWADSPVTTEALQGEWLLEQQKPTPGQLHILNRRNAGATPSELAQMNSQLHAIEAMFEGYGKAIEIRGRTLYRTEAVRQFGMALRRGRHFTINGNALEFDDGSPRILVKVGSSTMLHVEQADPSTGKPEIRYLYKRMERGARPWTHHVMATAVPADVKVNHQRVPPVPKPAMATGSEPAPTIQTTPPEPEPAPATPDSPITAVEPPAPAAVPEPTIEIGATGSVEIDVPDLPDATDAVDPLVEIDIPDLPDTPATEPAPPDAVVEIDVPDLPDIPSLPDFDAPEPPAAASTAGAPDDLSLPPVPATDEAPVEPSPPPAFDVLPLMLPQQPSPPPPTPSTRQPSMPFRYRTCQTCRISPPCPMCQPPILALRRLSQ